MKQATTLTTLIQGGTITLPEGMMEADLLVQGERIKAIGRGLPIAHDTLVVDAAGCYVLPGVIDAHTHIALDTGIYRTDDDWFTGTRAAACGGVTTVIDFAAQFPGQTLREAVAARQEEAQGATIDYGFHVMVTDLPPGREAELGDLVELGTPSVKLYTTYRPNYYADDATLLRLMSACARLGLRPLVHCENDDMVAAQIAALTAAGETSWQHHGQSRPPLAEQEAIQRILFLADAAGCPVHICHCSTARSVDLVLKARADGQEASCETCPQYLLLDHTAYAGPEAWRFILQPPLREAGEPEQLWALVEKGAVELVVTDHCDYTATQKQAVDDLTRTPGGLPGVETLLPLMFTYGVAGGRLTMPQLARLLSTNPAQLWGLWPRKGALLPGFDADIVVYDPEPETAVAAGQLHHQAGYTPYEGMTIRGQVRATICRGHLVYCESEFRGREGGGAFVKRSSLPGLPPKLA
ncbi:MAG: dihydropyrimidinase [Anaerolineae bacterium]|nr:dihydropyrimidinase [Anaerolineae bacterium]